MTEEGGVPSEIRLKQGEGGINGERHIAYKYLFDLLHVIFLYQIYTILVVLLSAV